MYRWASGESRCDSDVEGFLGVCILWDFDSCFFVKHQYTYIYIYVPISKHGPDTKPGSADDHQACFCQVDPVLRPRVLSLSPNLSFSFE